MKNWPARLSSTLLSGIVVDALVLYKCFYGLRLGIVLYISYETLAEELVKNT